jgi:hypothetical protein
MLRRVFVMMRTSPIWSGNVREPKIGSAVSHAARSSGLALLEGGEAAITRARKFVALYAVTIVVGRNVAHASCEHDRGDSEDKKNRPHFSLLRLSGPRRQ